MADYVKNVLVCDKELGNRILTKNQNYYNFDFNTLIKVPDDLTGNSCGDWIAKNWGTTSNAMDCRIVFNENDNSFIVTFITNWCPPKNIIEKLDEISGDQNFTWISIHEVNDFLTKWTKDESGCLTKIVIHHNLDFYGDDVFQSMVECSLNLNDNKKIK